MRVLLPLLRLPEKLFFARTLRTHLFTNYRIRKVRDSAKWLIPLWVSIWVLLVSAIYLWMSYQAVGKRRESLASMCDERARMLQDQLNVSMNHLKALAMLVSTLHHSKRPSAMDQKAFARYADRTAFERPLTSGVVYGVRVTHAERERFERQQGWSIKKMYSSKTKKQSQGPGKAEDAEVREPAEEYAPVIFAQDAYKHVISFDLLSGADDRNNVLRARKSGKGVLSAPFKLPNNRLGVISTYAVYKYELPTNARPHERIQAVIGYLGGIFDIEALVDKLLHQLASKQSIVVKVYDTTNARPIIMYGSNDTGRGMLNVRTLNFGDPSRKHEMHCRFIQSPPWPWMAITTSFGTLVIALLIGYIIYATSKRIARIEDDFQEMSVLKKRAEDADIAKSQFLATVSHEIRTPMNGVLGMLQMLMDTDLDKTQQDYVRTAQASGKALVSLINEVLDQAKIESGKLELEAVPFDLRTVCDDILSLFCGKAQEKGLELAVFVSDQVPQTLIGDPGRIRQIITNLVGNSIKFTERGHIYLTVHVVEEIMHCLEVETGTQYANTLSGYPVANRKRSWESFQLFRRELNSSKLPFAPVASDSISLIISVEDTGVGIPFDAQSSVFTPFMQVGPSIGCIHGGTGIGLSISKCLVGLMKGEIGFASTPLVGSTFTFTVVLTRAHSSRNENKLSEFKEINALVVDHRPARAKVTKYHLQRLGVQTELTTDLDHYISKINCGPHIAKLVLIDKETWLKESHSMPLLVTKLRNKDQPHSTKLFLLENPKSSVKSNSHIFREYNLNIIMKPLRASMLQVSLQRALGGIDKLHCRNGVVGNSTLGSLLHKKRIIVVDDNIVNLKVAAGALRKYGAEVTCADNGKKAITLLKPPHGFDACFMDIQMPQMDGFEATRRIRVMERDLNEQIERGEAPPECVGVQQWRTPILAMTADVIQATYEQCLKSEMDGYVSKPFESEQLYREVARFFLNQDHPCPSAIDLLNNSDTWLEEEAILHPACKTLTENQGFKIHEVSPESAFSYGSTKGEMSSTPSISEFPTSSSQGAMGPLLRKLDLLLDSKNQLIRRSAKEAIKRLKEDLEEINADLVELSMVERPNYKTRYWMHEVRELSYHIEDCVDNMVQSRAAAEEKLSFSGHRLRVRHHVKIPCLPKTMKPSARIAELRMLLWEASERHERYQLQDCVSSETRFLFSGSSRSAAVAAVVAGAADNLVGVDGTRGELTSWLIDQTEEEHRQLKVLSILGPAGVGKTALVKDLYRQLGHQFKCRAFVRVSRNPDMRRLLGEILAQVQGRKRDYGYEDTSTEDNLMDSIRSHLQDKRYFVVIDELWDAAAWDIMNIAFPKGNNCSRIIITAEGKDVASKCYYVNNLEMTPLGSLQDSGKIFFDRVFGSEHQCPDQLKDISCMIIRSCGGFPLAITAVASLLASQIDKTEIWDYLQKCSVSRLTGVTLEETCKEVVNICYDALPQDLKTCLLYLTMYPEGSTIRKADLLNQWIAEGFITPKEENQTVAESYFSELINRGMIQPENIDHNDEVLSCTVHHIVFDLIAQKSKEENFITAVDYSQVLPGFSMIARRLTLHYSCAQFAAKPEGLKLSQVRSLAFYGLLKCMPSITEFKFLRVLILEFWGNNYHHNSSLDLSKLCILFHLRYLKVSSHTIIELPSKIQRLQSLETLEIYAKVSAVPTGILHLPGLLHLSLPNGTELPDGIGRITSLKTLEHFDLGSNSEYNVKSLGELINLQNLHVTSSRALSEHHLKINLLALSSSIGNLFNLKSLRVGPFAVGMTMFIDQDDMPCTPKLLQRLELLPSSCIFSRLPTWIGGLEKLRILKIAVRLLLSSDIDTLTGLPVLAVLSLYVQKPNAGSVIFNSGSLPALKYFKYRCAALRLGFQKEALPNLQRLKLCFNVHRAESYTSNLAGIENLLQLKEITAEIGAAAGALDMRAAESALKEATRKHPRSPIHIYVKSVDCIEEESTPVGFMHLSPYIVAFLALAVSVVVRRMLP